MKTSVCLCSVLLVLSFMDLCLCGDQKNITAEPGQNVNLSCKAAGNGIVIVVRLTRDDLKPQYVLLYRDDQIDEHLLNPQFKDRTKVQSLISTDGEINLTLDDVTEKDSGVYECRVKTETKSNTRRKRAAIESTFINLRVAAAQSAPPGKQDGNREEGNQHGGNTDGLGVGRSHAVLFVAVSAVVSVIVSMAITVFRRRIKTPSPPDDAEKPQLI